MELTTITIRIPKDEKLLVLEYAKLHNTSLPELYRNALLSRIEDELDLTTLKNSIEESKDDPGISQEEMEKVIEENMKKTTMAKKEES